jgi:hypothetical protein
MKVESLLCFGSSSPHLRCMSLPPNSRYLAALPAMSQLPSLFHSLLGVEPPSPTLRRAG